MRPCLGNVGHLWASKSEGLFIKIIYSVLCLLGIAYGPDLCGIILRPTGYPAIYIDCYRIGRQPSRGCCARNIATTRKTYDKNETGNAAEGGFTTLNDCL